MKKIYLLCLSIIGIVQLNGQITLTAENNIPAYGSVFSYVKDTTFHIVPIANVTWDLSFISGHTVQVKYPAAENTIYKNLYPGADMAEVNFHAQDNIFKVTDSSISYIAHYGDRPVRYTDDRLFLKFPITNNTTYIDSFSGVIEFLGLEIIRTGTVEIKADGFGSLKLPYGTVDDVMRILLVSNYTDKYDQNTYTHYMDSVILWYNLHTSNRIASYNTRYDDQGFGTFYNAVYLIESDVVTGVEEIALTVEDVKIYPNPASGNIVVELQDNKQYSLYIRDIRGVILYNDAMFINKTDISLEVLNPGYYIIQLISEAGIINKPIVIQR